MSTVHQPHQVDDGVVCSCGKDWPCPEKYAGIGSVGLWRTSDHRYYWSEKPGEVVGPLTSVTTAMKAVDKSGPLIGWAKRVTAEAAVTNAAMLQQMIATGGQKAAVDWLKALPGYKRDSAADLGTRVHILAEQIANGGHPEMTDEEAPFVTAYRCFLDDYKPTFLRVEAMVCNLTHGYAGTLDFLAVIDGATTLGDIKTGSGAYAETAIQLSALANGEFLGWPGDPRKHPLPHIEQHVVLHLRPDLYPDTGYRLIPYKVTPDTFWRFLEAKGMWEWLQGEAKTVMGAPLAPKKLEEVAA